MGQDEEPFSAVRRADVRSLDEDRLNPVASAFKVGLDSSEVSMPNESAHVFDEDPGGVALSDDPEGVGPEMARVIFPRALSGDAPRLAGDAARYAIHDATPRSAVEGSYVRPHRRRIKASLFHPLRQDEDRRCFVFHATNRASLSNSESESEVQTTGSGAEGKHVEGTYSHTQRLALPFHAAASRQTAKWLT